MIDSTHARRILIVDDEAAVVDVIRAYLQDEGFDVACASDGERGLAMAIAGSFSLVLLDLNLPKLSGIEVFRQLRRHSNVPVIMVTTRGAEIDRVLGLELGADDYVAKPFSPRELVARVKNVLRRGTAIDYRTGHDVQRIGNLEIDRTGHLVNLEGKKVRLTPMEFRILDVFAQHPGQVFTRTQLLDLIAGNNDDIYDRTLDRHIANLRRKLNDHAEHPVYIETILGIGYKFIADAETSV